MIAIAAVDANWGIGKNGQLLEHLSLDMKHFARLTKSNENNGVIMGRKTLESMPNGKPLPSRRNIIVSRKPAFTKDSLTYHSLSTAVKMAKIVAKNHQSTIYVIGGGSIYEQLIDKCSLAIITKIHKAYEGVDTYFPNLDQKSNWVFLDSIPHSENGIDFDFVYYYNTMIEN